MEKNCVMGLWTMLKAGVIYNSGRHRDLPEDLRLGRDGVPKSSLAQKLGRIHVTQSFLAEM